MTTQSPSKAARASREKLKLPTYPVSKANINPIISEYRNEKPYPYRMWDDLSDERVEAEYDALVAENEYLRITVLPALGGKLYSALDKRNGQEVFYRNHVVKPQLIGLTGAWTSGGLEFNFPIGHRPTTMETIETDLVQRKDGSASIYIGETDRISGVRFMVELKLEPGKAYIEQKVTITNPTSLPQRFFYWNTASYPETPNLECRYPAQWMIEEWTRVRKPWPYDREVDVRNSRNIQKFSSIFTTGMDEDYFGLYDRTLGRGTVHVADHREVPGKKFWSWGQSGAGKLWNEVLTDEDGPYMEHQAGNIETQCEYRYLQPYQKHSWKEYWYQAIDTGPFTYANCHAVVAARFQSESEEELKLDVSLQLNEEWEDGLKLTLTHDDGLVYEGKGRWSPAETVHIPLRVHSGCLSEGTLRLTLTGPEEQLLVDYVIRQSAPALEEIDEPASTMESDDLSTRLVKIAKIEERLLYRDTIKLYNELLEDYPLYVEAYSRKAAALLKMLLPEAAYETMKKALALTPFHDESHYYAGVAAFACGRLEQAKTHLLSVTDTSAVGVSTTILLGKIALRQGKWSKAAPYFAKALLESSRSDTAAPLLAYSLRKQGQRKEAEAALRRHLEQYPIDLLSAAELDLLTGSDTCLSLVRDDVHSITQLAQFYEEVGDLAAQEAVLRWYPDQGHPIVLYHLGLIASRAGREAEAVARYTEAEGANPDYVFPMAQSTLLALRDAAGKLGEKALLARYLTGLIYNSRERFDEAVGLWKQCVEAGMEYSVLYRNLGHYYMQQGQDDLAIEILEQGLDKSPVNPDIRIYLNALNTRKGWTDKRIALLPKDAEPAKLGQMFVRMLIGIYNDTGRYEEALKLLTSYRFRNWEMEYVDGLNLRVLYRDTLLGLAKGAMAERRWDDALRQLEQSMVYPENMQMGPRWDQFFIEELYLQAVCLERKGSFTKAVACCNEIIRRRLSPGEPEYGIFVKAVQKKTELEWLGFDEQMELPE